MRRKRIINIALLLLTFVVCGVAQEPIVEYGEPTELRSVTKIFVDTGVDSQQRQVLVKEIQKRLPELEIVSRPEDSDIHLRFSLLEGRGGEREWIGTVVKVMGSSRVRVLFNSKDRTPPIFERGSLIDYAIEYAQPHLFAREFVKAYRRANGGGPV
jgi:hypothetical protein